MKHCASSILRARGLISATTLASDAELSTFFQRVKHLRYDDGDVTSPPSPPPPISCYVGFDPTADSLHVGNLVSLRVLQMMQHHGFRPIALVGGATGLIGDPSGRSTERSMQSTEQIHKNAEGIEACVRSLLRQDTSLANKQVSQQHTVHAPVFVNNLDWYLNQTPIDFIRDVGRHFRMGSMLSRDSVKSRLESEGGMSFTEFSYQLFQAYDFLHLHREHQCALQIGGSDQWGNIVGGCDLIRRVGGQQRMKGEREMTKDEASTSSNNSTSATTMPLEAHGLTVPLLTTSTGEKLGKSAGNAIWVDPDRTSPYELYQYFLNIADDDVGRCYSMLAVDLTLDENETTTKFNEMMEIHERHPEKRFAQRELADAVVSWIHGDDGLRSARKATQALFGGGGGRGSRQTMSGSNKSGTRDNEEDDGAESVDWRVALKDAPACEMSKGKIIGSSILELAMNVGLFKSRGEARRMIKSGGMYLNQERVDDGERVLSENDLINNDLVLLRVGKKKYMLVDVC